MAPSCVCADAESASPLWDITLKQSRTSPETLGVWSCSPLVVHAICFSIQGPSVKFLFISEIVHRQNNMLQRFKFSSHQLGGLESEADIINDPLWGLVPGWSEPGDKGTVCRDPQRGVPHRLPCTGRWFFYKSRGGWGKCSILRASLGVHGQRLGGTGVWLSLQTNQNTENL